MKKTTLFLAMLFHLAFLTAQPKQEVRAVWLTTNHALDWPSNKNANGQMAELSTMLNKLQKININTIVFQVQCRSDVFWASEYQPWSRFLTGTPGQDPGYDVLQFAINECHKRNMEIHAWIVPYPLGKNDVVEYYGEDHVVRKHPELCLYHGSEWYLDPGYPQTTEYLLNLYGELIKKYDFDGINLDYTRYPGSDFPDTDSYSKYGNKKNKNDWRRENINKFVHQLHDTVKMYKPDMKMGAAPIGAYESLPNASSGFTAYNHVYQDPVEWMSSDKLDLAMPQVYWTKGYGPQLKNWITKSSGKQISAGLAVYKMDTRGNGGEDWESDVIIDQIDEARELGSSGICFFRTRYVSGNMKNLYTKLQDNSFKYPANIPPMPWSGESKPAVPEQVNINNKAGNIYTINWSIPEVEGQPIRYYCVYVSNTPDIDIEDVKNIAGHYITGASFEYEITDPTKDHYFTVTAFDKGYYESNPSEVLTLNGTSLDQPKLPMVQFAVADEIMSINADKAIVSVAVYAINGRNPVNRNTNQTNIDIDLSSLEQGVYIVVVRLEDGTTVNHKFIK